MSSVKQRSSLTTTASSPVAEKEDKKAAGHELVWRNIILYTFLHAVGLIGLVAIPFAKWQTLVWCLLMYIISGIGITAGAHRLWSHRSYKAKAPLRVLLVCMASCVYENSLFEWVRDHRVHHKYTDTNADPHNALRGFFFSHVGWLLVKKHPDVAAKGKQLNFDDIYADKVVMFQHKYKFAFMAVFTFGIPFFVPFLWGEGAVVSYFLTITRYVLMLNATWAVNSFAHLYGDKPYDKSINPSENTWVSLFAVGEGFHNFHHTFPMDYATSELGLRLNPTTWFINFMALIGQAYDLKKMTPQMVEARKQRTGELAPAAR